MGAVFFVPQGGERHHGVQEKFRAAFGGVVWASAAERRTACLSAHVRVLYRFIFTITHPAERNYDCDHDSNRCYNPAAAAAAMGA